MYYTDNLPKPGDMVVGKCPTIGTEITGLLVEAPSFSRLQHDWVGRVYDERTGRLVLVVLDRAAGE